MQYPEKQADWLGLVLGLARFEIRHWPPAAQNSKAMVLGLTLGLARFDSVWLHVMYEGNPKNCRIAAQL